jgi:hypothetical protein
MIIINFDVHHLNNQELTTQRETTFGTRHAVKINKTKNIAQKYIKMSNMADITKKHSTEINKDEQHGRHHQKT